MQGGFILYRYTRYVLSYYAFTFFKKGQKNFCLTEIDCITSSTQLMGDSLPFSPSFILNCTKFSWLFLLCVPLSWIFINGLFMAYDLMCSGWNGWRSLNLAHVNACTPTCWRANVCGMRQLVCTSNAAAQTSGGNCSTPTPHASTITMPLPNALSGTAHMDATSFPSPSSRRSSRTQTHRFLLLRWSVDQLTAALLAALSAPPRHKSRRIKRHPERKERGETESEREERKENDSRQLFKS